MATGCYPGSFNPPTLAHLAIAEAAAEACALDRVDLVVSRVALDKEHVVRPDLDDRIAVLDAIAANHAGLAVAVTDQQLLVDVARGYDVLVLGADKWAQVCDPQYYGGSSTVRDAALGLLPRLAVAPRAGHATSRPAGAVVLDLPVGLLSVSSTRARAGEARVDGARGPRVRPPHRRLERSGPVRRMATPAPRLRGIPRPPVGRHDARP